MNLASRLWHELIRARGPIRHRYYRVVRSSRTGVALLMAMSSILLMSVLVTETVHGATVRLSLASHHRDEAKAEALAMSGLQFYRMILMASKAVGRNPMIQSVSQYLGINGDSLWQLLPRFNTQLIRMVFVSGGEMDEEEVAAMRAAGLSDDQLDETREARSSTKRNFLDFDGDFSAHVKDEARFIFVGGLQATDLGTFLTLHPVQQLQGMMNKEEHNQFFYDNNMDRVELIANLVDWTDPDDLRLFQGGYEESLYDNLENPYRPKNAAFDTREEIRLVDGWHLDGVWERFGRYLTIYGEGKVNVNTAPRPVVRGLLTAYADGYYAEAQIELWLDLLFEYRGRPVSADGVYFNTPQGFVSFMSDIIGMPMREDITEAITTESSVFRVVSTGEVGDARVEMVAVYDFSQDPTGRILHYRIR